MTVLGIGRLLRASTTGFVVGCSVSQLSAPGFGALVRVPLANDYQVYGLIHDIHIDDDGLVRQIATNNEVPPEVIADSRYNRNVPVEMGVLAVGYQQGQRISHLLPPLPPLSLDMMFLCECGESCAFTSHGHFGYFRHILRATDLPVGELLAAHLRQMHESHQQGGNADWLNQAVQELIVLLRDDYPTLMSVLGAVSELEI